MQLNQSTFLKGVSLAKHRNYSQALDAFTQQIGDKPDKFPAYLNRGSIQCILGFDEFAIDDFNKVIELAPYEITGYYNRFVSNYKVGKKVEAQHDLYIALSLACMRKGQLVKQVSLIGKSLDIVENNALAHIKRGNLYKEQGNLEMAVNDYTGALEADDKNITALTLRAYIYKQTNREQEAQEDLQRIKELTEAKQKAKVILVPKISQMTPSELEIDIVAKIKQFIGLRHQIYKAGFQKTGNIRLEQSREYRLEASKGQKDKQKSEEQRLLSNNNQSLEYSNNFINNSDEQYINISQKSEQDGTRALQKGNVEGFLTASKDIKEDVSRQIKSIQSVEQKQIQKSLSTSQIKSELKNARLVESQVQPLQSPKGVGVQKKLRIFVEKAKLIRNTEIFGKMSPYTFISYNGWEQKTEVLIKAGFNPVWRQTLTFNYSQNAKNITFKCWDKESFKNDDLIGEATLKLADIMGGSRAIPLKYKNDLAAELTISIDIKE